MFELYGEEKHESRIDNDMTYIVMNLILAIISRTVIVIWSRSIDVI